MIKLAIKHVVFVGFIFGLVACGSTDDKQVSADSNYDLETVDKAVDYVYELDADAMNETHIADLISAINEISHAIQTIPFVELEMTRLHFFRAKGLEKLNKWRDRNDKPVNTEEIKMMVADYDVLLAKDDEPSINYTIGSMIFNHLKDVDLASSYWKKCAEKEHAGCMNTLANVYFNGSDGYFVDLAKSAYWHQKVVDTGTRYRCAGIYSSYNLAQITYTTPSIQTGKTTEQWLKTADELFGELYKEYKPTDVLCHVPEFLVYQYSMFAEDKAAAKPLLTKALEYDYGDSYRQFIQGLIDDKPLDSLIPMLAGIDSKSLVCDSYLNLLALAKDRNNEDLAEQLIYLISIQDKHYCQYPMSVIDHMKAAGRW